MSRPTLLQFNALRADFAGELYYDTSTTHEAIRRLYATDASVYQELPMAVALPRHTEDIKRLIAFASRHAITLIPRAAGTSLAGQVVGNGLVVDISKHFGKLLEINAKEKWVRVQPGVIRDDLNKHLAPHGLLFGPETSTASRAMIGGMIGNNSCGLHSIIWGSTRDHLLEVKVLLADGSEATFSETSTPDFLEKVAGKAGVEKREQTIYAGMWGIISNPVDQELIEKNFPKKSVTRRNSGYALDSLLVPEQRAETSRITALPTTLTRINLARLIAGSGGTLCFVTEAKLNLVDLPPAAVGVVCVHTHSLAEALQVNRIAMQHAPKASELVDKFIMDFTKEHHEYSKNRFFLEGDPAALLLVEFWGDTEEEVQKLARAFTEDLKLESLGYAYPLLFGSDAVKAWDIRKAGLGLIRNLPGDTQPVNLIEDCAVAVEDLPDYIADLEKLLAHHQLHASYYAHAGAGELHVEPMINLKTRAGKQKFRDVLADTAALVKKYRGSLSGEHGDGRLRGEFIPFMMGDEVYELFRQVKRIWDPKGVFNANKIVDTPPMNEFLRYVPDAVQPEIATVLDFSREEGILRLTEKCSGSGDCRKTELTGGTMCPSYMATRSERDTTRARANILRQYYTQGTPPQGGGKADAEMVKEVLDLCLSCKGCKAECPSSVDVGKMKAEFTQQYHDTHGVPFRSKLVAGFTRQMELAMWVPWAYNAVFGTPFLRRIANRVVGFHPNRTMPALANQTLRKWLEERKKNPQNEGTPARMVYVFCDEFSNFNDVEIGKKMVLLLEGLGYEVRLPSHVESGRTYLSKGLVKEAQKIANRNVQLLSKVVSDGHPLIGIEPSAILTFRDEYPDLVAPELREEASKLAQNALLFEEFIAREMEKKALSSAQFTTEKKLLKLHGHCHQKALSSLSVAKKILSLPINYKVHLIPSGCCGMAGSFGYEQEHYDLSMQIGELVLFPAVRNQPDEVLIVASGTSCRHQIHDGTGRKALHPVEILWDALKK